MSGKPSLQNVSLLKARVARYISIADSLATAQAKLSVLKKDVETLEHEGNEVEREIRAMLENMDLASPGNFGFQERFIAFLCLQNRLEKQDKAAEQFNNEEIPF